MTDRNADTQPPQRTITFAIKRVDLVVQKHGGTERVAIDLDAPTAFPDIGHPPTLHLECASGHGADWCRAVGLEIDEVIET